VVIDTPKGSRNKFKYDEEFALFRLSKLLPVGAAFPYDFGFIPSTRAEDNEAEGRRFEPLARRGPAAARASVARSMRQFKAA